MIKELDLVVLTHDIIDYELEKGDVGTVIYCYDDKEGFEVEFVTVEGKTIAVLTLSNNDIRPFQDAEILHTREVPAMAI